MSSKHDHILAASAFILLAAPVEGQGTPDRAGFDHPFHRKEDRRITRKMCHGDSDMVFFREMHYAVGLVQVGAHRFFAEDMDAELCRRFDLSEMISRQTRTKNDDIRFFPFQHDMIIGIVPFCAGLFQAGFDVFNV